MIDPPKLKFASQSGVARVLLESAARDHSAPGAEQRALQALGATAGITLVGAAAQASAATSSQWTGVLIVKWLGLGLTLGVATLTSAEYIAQRMTEPRAVSQPVRMAAPRAAPQKAQPVALAVDVLPPKSAEAEKVPRSPAARVAALGLPSADVRESSSGPASEQLRALQVIRATLAERAPERALSLLDAFDQRYRSSALSEEAAVLRVEALADAGHADARSMGQRFLQKYPASAYFSRVRSKLQIP